MPSQNRKFIENVISKTKIYLVIIFILFTILCIYDARLIVPSIILFVGILSYSIYTSKKRKAEISNHIHGATEEAICALNKRVYREYID